MSGHSKWSQIKHQKAITDKKRGQLFSKLSKLISLAAKKDANPETNLELKNAVEKARAMNMPNDNIRRALNKILSKSSDQLEELHIEALGPGNVAITIKAITDNRNRTISEIKKILADNGAKMVQSGSISWMFDLKVPIEDLLIQNNITKLFEALDDHDDVEDITSNLQE